MKINASICIELNAGTSLLIYILSFLVVLIMSKWIDPVAQNLASVLITLTGGEAGYLLQRHGKNRLDTELEKTKLSDCQKGDSLS